MDFYKRLRVAKKATKLIVAGSSSADSLKKTSKAEACSRTWFSQQAPRG
jgi:hypothetical protein